MAMKPFRDHCHHWVRRLNRCHQGVEEVRHREDRRWLLRRCHWYRGFLVSRGEGEEQMAWVQVNASPCLIATFVTGGGNHWRSMYQWLGSGGRSGRDFLCGNSLDVIRYWWSWLIRH